MRPARPQYCQNCDGINNIARHMISPNIKTTKALVVGKLEKS